MFECLLAELSETFLFHGDSISVSKDRVKAEIFSRAVGEHEKDVAALEMHPWSQ